MGKVKVATCSLAGCFGCHMSLLDIDEKLLDLLELVEFDRSPINDIKTISAPVDVGLIEGGVCNVENVHTPARVPKDVQGPGGGRRVREHRGCSFDAQWHPVEAMPRRELRPGPGHRERSHSR